MKPISPRFEKIIEDLHGAAGVAWLEKLPQFLAEIEARWDLRIREPFEPLNYNYVAPAVGADGGEVVVKLGYPDPTLQREAAALKQFKGRASARLLDADLDMAVLVLERLKPGEMLVTLAEDVQATAIAAGVMGRLPAAVPENHPFRTAADRAGDLASLRKLFDGGTGPFPEKLVDRAEKLFAELLASADSPVLLHGDLHHENILSADREPWLAIDPKGIVGELAYEPAAYLLNPVPHPRDWPDPLAITRRRVDQFAEILNLDRERIKAWAIAHAVLSDWWYFEDHGRLDDYSLPWAELFSQI